MTSRLGIEITIRETQEGILEKFLQSPEGALAKDKENVIDKDNDKEEDLILHHPLRVTPQCLYQGNFSCDHRSRSRDYKKRKRSGDINEESRNRS